MKKDVGRFSPTQTYTLEICTLIDAIVSVINFPPPD
jgi:hypothetical protein